MDLISYKGTWFLPDSEEMNTGELKYNQDNIQLSLVGNMPDQCQVLWGKENNGELITLINCIAINIQSNVNDKHYNYEIVADYIFVGAHFKNKEDIKFTGISYRCTNLDEWMWRNSFTTKKENNKYIVEYEAPQPISIKLDNTLTLDLYAIVKSPPQFSIPFYKAELEEQSYVGLRVKETAMFFHEFNRWKYIMDCFLTMAIGATQKTTELLGHIGNNCDIMIYYTPYNVPTIKTILPPNMRFSYKNVKANWSVLITNWFNCYNHLEAILNTYFSVLQFERMYVEQRFLSYVQVLESYHRLCRKNDEEDKLKEIIQAITSNTEDKEHRNFLNERLEYAYEPNLRNRLKFLIKEGIISKTIFKNSRQKDGFINDVCNTRNYLTHYNQKLADKAKRGVDLYIICERLNVIIQYLLLKEIGFDEEMCENILKEIIKMLNFNIELIE